MCWSRLPFFTGDQTIHPWPNRWSMTKPSLCDQTLHTWPNCSPLTKCPTVHLLPNHSAGTTMTKLFNCDHTVYRWPGGLSVTVTLSGASLWLWHFLGALYDCGTSWGPSMIVAFHGPLYGCGTSWGCYDCSLWFWNCLWPPYDCDTSYGLSLIVTLLVLTKP